MTDKPFATVTWKVELIRDGFGIGVRDFPRIAESSLSPMEKQRHYGLIYEGAYSLGNKYLEEYLTFDLIQIDRFPEESATYLVTMGLLKDWDQPDGPSDVLIKVEEVSGDTKTLIWSREEPTTSEPMDSSPHEPESTESPAQEEPTASEPTEAPK